MDAPIVCVEDLRKSAVVTAQKKCMHERKVKSHAFISCHSFLILRRLLFPLLHVLLHFVLPFFSLSLFDCFLPFLQKHFVCKRKSNLQRIVYLSTVWRFISGSMAVLERRFAIFRLRLGIGFLSTRLFILFRVLGQARH